MTFFSSNLPLQGEKQCLRDYEPRELVPLGAKMGLGKWPQRREALSKTTQLFFEKRKTRKAKIVTNYSMQFK